MGKLKIIVIDDAKFICDTVTAWLKGSYDIVTFLNGKDGLEYLAKNDADLVLLDYDMPGMTGYEVLIGIRTSKKTSKLPVIFLTGVTNERMSEEMLHRGANDYITKPLDINHLKESISKFI